MTFFNNQNNRKHISHLDIAVTANAVLQYKITNKTVPVPMKVC